MFLSTDLRLNPQQERQCYSRGLGNSVATVPIYVDGSPEDLLQCVGQEELYLDGSPEECPAGEAGHGSVVDMLRGCLVADLSIRDEVKRRHFLHEI